MYLADYSLRGFETKSLSDDKAEFTGVASTSDTDLEGDIIEPGAFGRSLGDVVLLRDHNPSKVIGKISQFEQDGKHLHVAGEIGFDTDVARETYALMKRGYLSGISPGFIIQKGGVRRDEKSGQRRITGATMFECSIVAMPANQHARVRNVKAILKQVGARDFLFSLGFDEDEAEVIAAKGLDALLGGHSSFQPPRPLAEEISPQVCKEIRELMSSVRKSISYGV